MKETSLKILAAIKNVFGQDAFIQNFNGLPIFLNSAAWTGFTMKKDLGYGYTKFAFHYHNGSGEMAYLKSDFMDIWRRFKSKMKANPRYLSGIKKLYERKLRSNHKLFRRLDKTDLAKITDRQLVRLFHEGVAAQINSGNVAHVIEGLSHGAEFDLRRQLEKELKDFAQYNHIYASLSAPTELSFVAKEQARLFAISRLSKTKQDRALQAHTDQYYWIHNNYAGAKRLTPAFFARQMKLVKRPLGKTNSTSKKQLATRYGLSVQTLQLAHIIDFLAVWQDERKAHLMQATAYLAPILRQLENRTGLAKGHLNYAMTQEGLSWSLEDCRKMKTELASRSRGVYILMTSAGEQVVSGAEYKKLSQSMRIMVRSGQTKLQGTVASGGIAVGTAVICLGLKMMAKVRKGNILVTSMTRPEYMPALRKAAAIVTDEGGITSHAAIVARELRIPAVIGTQHATRVFKDGDKLEVNANTGIVRKLTPRKP